MRHDLRVTGSIEVKATPRQVWKGMTEPEIISKYLFGTRTTTDWKVGSEVIFEGEYGENLEHKYRDMGVVLENEPFRRLSYSYWTGFSGLENKPENYATVTYIIEEKDTHTAVLTWDQKGYSSQEGYEHSLNGMPDFLKGIARIIEELPD